MSPAEPPDPRRPPAPPWSPKTETREDYKALLRRRSALSPEEALLFRDLCSDIYDTFAETLSCVVRSRGATGTVEMDLVHDAFATFLDETIASGFPESIQAKLLSLASGRARNYVRREGRNPATQALPTSSKEAPGSFPRIEGTIDLKEVARAQFERLSPEHKAVISAVVFRDLTVKSAALELGLARTTASSRLTAALTLLNGWMDEMLTESEKRF
jgi:DNA-directed RNA polymerase specialized sigma24 family protein